MGQSVENFGDMVTERLIQVAVNLYVNGVSEQQIKKSFHFDDNQMEEVFKKAERMNFLEKMESNFWIQKAAKALMKGYPEDKIQEMLEISDEQMEVAKEICEKMKNGEIKNN